MKVGTDNHKNTLKTAWNDVTGDTIKTGKGSQDKYAEGWDAIFGKKEKEPLPLSSGVHCVVLSEEEQADVDAALDADDALQEINQCDGCRCCWPIDDTWEGTYHQDPSGYSRHIACTAHLYDSGILAGVI